MLLGAVCAGAQVRDPSWAEPVPAIHFDNLYRIDEGVYRSEQPSAEGFSELWRMGVREVLNLRNHHDDGRKAEGLPFVLHSVRMNAGKSVTDQFAEALRIIGRRQGPIVIHCWHGSDRTGVVTALYRIVFQGWSRERAFDELSGGGYGYHAFFYGNIRDYILKADLETLKEEVLQP